MSSGSWVSCRSASASRIASRTTAACRSAAAILLIAVALWGTAFGGAPTLLQTAMVDVSGTGHTDVANSMLATVYNVGIAVGSLAGAVVLDGAGARAPPWTALPLVAAALATVAVARRHAFPANRPGHRPLRPRTAPGHRPPR
jgi:predicted MFS family arabinose efflux permease